ncbi:MAG: VWA domain-containing protein [Spirosoma sp.]|nr:VWA domain-containing protein [Spirosoma sp.]
MSRYLLGLLLLVSTAITAWAQRELPQPSLNQYVAFLNQSVEVLTRRFQMVQTYQANVTQYRKKPDVTLSLPSSGPLEDYYYRKALSGNGLTANEQQRLTASTRALWQLLTKLDQTGKALETYVSLNAYTADNLKQSDALVAEMQVIFSQFSRDKALLYGQIQQIYRRYQPYSPNDPYLAMEKEMTQVLLSQQQLLDSLPCYLHDDSRSAWPVTLLQQSMLADEQQLSTFGKAGSGIAYPASDAVTGFASELRAMQTLKRRAIDGYTFAARQSARYGNEVYRSLLSQYNQGLVASYRAFVTYGQTARHLLDYPTFSPVFAPEPPVSDTPATTRTPPFTDKPRLLFDVKPAASPVSRATFLALNGYVEFINESLRQMRIVQVVLRNYQASAEHYRDPAQAKQRTPLRYAHDDYQVPVSAYQLLLNSSAAIPSPYRTSLTNQAEVLLAMLREMDGLSIELIGYTNEKQYLTDQLTRSNAILDRYAYLFLTFDQNKERLYADVRRVYESYPASAPTSSWQIAGRALRKTLDADHAVLFGVKAYLNGEQPRLPTTDTADTQARQLIADEYQNLNGLKRYGRNNGLCPYSPYEDLAKNTTRFAEMIQRVNTRSSSSTTHPYESFFYFYNNELVYQYNKFSELAQVSLLKAINQPDVFAFRRLPTSQQPVVTTDKTSPAVTVSPVNSTPKKDSRPVKKTDSLAVMAGPRLARHDTIYVSKNRVDTVYLERTGSQSVGQQTANPSLTGFAANNMVLLLDVSGSMDSPVKLPLLKRSIKSLLGLLRAEDQLSIVVYSGKARVVLKPTSGTEAANIARIIDELQSDGGTDADGGLRLAYKVANKNYLRAGNNRIILATDGEFPVSEEVLNLVGENARQDIHLTVFTFGRNPLTGQNLQKLSRAEGGTYAHVTAETATLQLILEAQAKRSPFR